MVRIAPSVSVSPLTTAAWSLEEDLALYRALGLDRASLSMAKMERAGGLDRAAGLVADSGLVVDLVYPAATLDLSRPGSWPREQDGLMAAVEAARLLGAGGIFLPTGGGHGLAWEVAVSRFCQVVSPVVDRARRAGVQALLEPVRPQFAYASFVHTFRDAIPLAQRLGAGIVFDVTHCWWEPDLAGLIATHVGLIGVVHLADLALDRPVVARLVPGDGELPLRGLVSALLAAGYAGPFELELIGPAIDAEGYRDAARRGVAYTRLLLEQLGP